LILRKIIQIVATRCHILRLKFAPPGPLPRFRGFAYKGKREKIENKERKGGVKKKEKDKKGRKGEGIGKTAKSFKDYLK